MRVANFSLLIPEGRERDSGHVEIAHGKVYTLRLMNHWQERACDAEVVIDGKPVGTFRVDAGRSVTLERPAHDDGRFTFYEATSGEAQAAGAGKVSVGERGLVQVRFRPGKPIRSHVLEGMVLCSDKGTRPRGGVGCQSAGNDVSLECLSAEQTVKAGVTGLSGQSGQRFVTVADLDYDPAHETTVTVRLVALPSGPRELTAAVSRANPVPSPVG